MTRKSLKRILIGRPLKNEELGEEKYGILWGLPILASDALSSVAYASEEILLILIPAIGILAYNQLTYISAAIIALLILLTLSYRQTIEAYPNGGGAYVVAKENIGLKAGVTAGSALMVGYVLTVAVSISSATAAITSAFPVLIPYTIPLCLVMLALITLGNLRGIGESSKIFSAPAYAFILGLIFMLIYGLIKLRNGYVPIEPPAEKLRILEPISMFLILRAFSSGCAALTGVEVVSNAVPNFKEPSIKNAKKVLLLLSALVFVLFGGTSILANLYHVVPEHDKTVLSQIAAQVFGDGSIMYYYMQAITAITLAMAANTAFTGFPMLVAVMAKEGYVPRQLSMRGDRLSYSNGIVFLAVIAAVLIVIFNANISSLIGLYAIGVFLSFTLSQSGMFFKWLRSREGNWIPKAIINGLGSLVTAVTVFVIAVTKFKEGTWIVVFLIPILIYAMMKVNNHYTAVAKQLRISPEELAQVDIVRDHYRNRVIVPVVSINKSSIRALRFARTISDNVVAFCVAIDDESGEKIKEKFALLNTNIPLIVKYSPYRKVVEPLLKFIESAEYDLKKGDMITVILSQFAVKGWWQRILHNQTRVFIERELLKHKHIVIATMPLQLKNDEFVLKSKKSN
ncbi:MAG: amino acid/polyamine/organocation transporter, superfamily [Clostridiales bacterium]|nr:amino acid/polyamine/organocation transporter, superfamily [Clostridiales bacterium]